MDQDVSKMKVSELREALKAKGLNTTGNKQELVDRLTAALLDGSHIDSKFEDELLNDDDLDNDEKSILESTKDLLQSPDTSSKSTTPETAAPAKKVILKRNIVAPVDTKEEEEKKSGGEDSSSEPEKKVIKISELSAKDRLEMRAKKFGATAVVSPGAGAAQPQEKLEARAARFGITAPAASTTANNSNSRNITTASAEVLKKRAERFGAISTTVKSTELEEKLLKRKERFGETASTTTTTTTSTAGKVPITAPSSATKVDYAEKARLRLERFKQTA